MRFFVIDHRGQKIPIKVSATSRLNLQQKYRNGKFAINGRLYSINDVIAESDENSAITGAVVGGILGAVAGAAGVGIGAALGGLLGKAQEESSKRDADKFNSERLL